MRAMASDFERSRAEQTETDEDGHEWHGYSEESSWCDEQSMTARLVEVDADAAAEALGSAKCLNVVLLGAAVHTGILALTADDIRSAI